MQKYNRLGFGIEIILKNTDFTVRANILRDDEKEDVYDVTLELKRKDMGLWNEMDGKHYRMNSQSINSDVYEMVTAKHKNGSLNYFINRYEYDIACMDRGDEYYREKKELFWSDDPKYRRSSGGSK